MDPKNMKDSAKKEQKSSAKPPKEEAESIQQKGTPVGNTCSTAPGGCCCGKPHEHAAQKTGCDCSGKKC
ncbi:hypothetical protein GE061_007461 [Apolygus lucorum]|uniref:Uncharacterized protein n=1 Tax=Apolygus lucorum TaxID=248454 RepID=A0A6A4J8W3_APOLU|nr:hypothetical protein GE061_007461 [Apolygus lucorum]